MENRIFLRAFEYNDLEKLNTIRNDDESLLNTCSNKFFISSEYDKKWIEDKIFNNQNQVYLAICLMNTKELIGYLGINEIDLRNRKAKWAGIILIKKFSGNGFATEASLLLLNFCFEELGLNRFQGYWLESNLPSIHMAEKLGFKKEGLLRSFVFKNNKFHNAYLMSLLKEEYNQSKND